MARYRVMDELQSIEFHDSALQNIWFKDNELHLLFSAAIIIGHSCPELNKRIPCSVNDGEDRCAQPHLEVTFKDFCIHSILRGGCWTKDEHGNTIAKYLPRNLDLDEYSTFFAMVSDEQYNHVYELNLNAETMIYTLCFFMNSDMNYYEMKITAATAIGEFEEFGKEAWYLEHYRKTRQQN